MIWLFRPHQNSPIIPVFYNTPLQYSCLENLMDGGAWSAAVHGVVRSRTRLSDFTFIFRFHALEKEMATHSSVLAWRIPEMGEPGGLPSMVSHRVRHDWSDLAVAAVHSVAPVYLSTFLLFLFQSKRTNCLVITHAFSFVPLAMSFHLCLSFISIFLLFSVLFKNVPY